MNTNAILIDPHNKTIEAACLDLTQGYSALRDAVFPNGEGSRLICHVGLGPVPGERPGRAPLYLSAFVDDEGLLMNWDDQAFFRFRFVGPTEAVPFAGRMIVVCTDAEGKTVGVPDFLIGALLERLRVIVEWMHPKDVRVPAPTLQPLGPDMQPEGEATPLDPSGRSEWDYEHQPSR